MRPIAFEAELLQLREGKPDEAWFQHVRRLYGAGTDAQRAVLQELLGWDDASCREPDDPFAADFADRHRVHLRTEERFHTYLLTRANGDWLVDYRDALIHLAGLYYLASLRGFDPFAVLEQVARTCAPASAQVLRSFLARPDKQLALWRYDAVRLPDGRVTLQFLGL